MKFLFKFVVSTFVVASLGATFAPQAASAAEISFGEDRHVLGLTNTCRPTIDIHGQGPTYAFMSANIENGTNTGCKAARLRLTYTNTAGVVKHYNNAGMSFDVMDFTHAYRSDSDGVSIPGSITAWVSTKFGSCGRWTYTVATGAWSVATGLFSANSLLCPESIQANANSAPFWNTELYLPVGNCTSVLTASGFSGAGGHTFGLVEPFRVGGCVGASARVTLIFREDGVAKPALTSAAEPVGPLSFFSRDARNASFKPTRTVFRVTSANGVCQKWQYDIVLNRWSLLSGGTTAQRHESCA